MTIDLSQLELTAVDALASLKKERDQLSERLTAMSARREQVSAEVYQRVHDDYRRRLDELASQAAPLKQKAGEVYRALRAELIRLDQEFALARLDREEIEFRHSLGEFGSEELKQKLQTVDARIEAHGQARQAASEMKARFLAVVESEAELDANDEDTARMTAITPPMVAAALSEPAPTVVAGPIKPPPTPDNAATVVAAPVPAPPAAVAAPIAPLAAPTKGAVSRSSRNPDATVVFRQGRLEPRNHEAGSVVQTLGLRPISIGADPGCDLQLSAPGVAKRHIEITMTRAGFSVRDVAASNTVKVNGDAVQERVLAEGDTLSVGPALFHFRLL